MSFKEALILAESVIKRFEKFEGKPWKAEGIFIELNKQIGELAKLIMKQEKYYNQSAASNTADSEIKGKIGDELADILLALIRLANYYKIDLLEAHVKAREGEDLYLKGFGY